MVHLSPGVYAHHLLHYFGESEECSWKLPYPGFHYILVSSETVNGDSLIPPDLALEVYQHCAVHIRWILLIHSTTVQNQNMTILEKS